MGGAGGSPPWAALARQARSSELQVTGPAEPWSISPLGVAFEAFSACLQPDSAALLSRPQLSRLSSPPPGCPRATRPSVLDASCKPCGPGAGGSGPGCALCKPQPSAPSAPPQAGGFELRKVGLGGSQGATPQAELDLEGGPEGGSSSSSTDLGRLGCALPRTGPQTSNLEGSVCCESQTPKPRRGGRGGGGGGGRDPVHEACLVTLYREHPICPLAGSLVRALATRAPIFRSYGLHVRWTPAPWGDLLGAQTPAEQTRVKQPSLPTQEAGWLQGGQTLWVVYPMLAGLPPPTATLSLLAPLSPTPP